MRKSQGLDSTDRNTQQSSLSKASGLSALEHMHLQNLGMSDNLPVVDQQSIKNSTNSNTSPSKTDNTIESILIIDPDRDFASTATDYLTLFGFQVSFRNSLASALDFNENSPSDLIFLSDNFDQVHPIDSLRKIKKVSKARIVVIASRGDDQLAVELIKAGASDYLSRRVKDKDILASLASLLSKLSNPSDMSNLTADATTEQKKNQKKNQSDAEINKEDAKNRQGERLVQFYESASKSAKEHANLEEIESSRIVLSKDDKALPFERIDYDDSLPIKDKEQSNLAGNSSNAINAIEDDDIFERLSLKAEFKSNQSIFSKRNQQPVLQSEVANISDLPGNLISLDQSLHIDVINQSASKILGFIVRKNSRKSVLDFIPKTLHQSFQLELNSLSSSCLSEDERERSHHKIFESVFLINNGKSIPVNCHLSCIESNSTNQVSTKKSVRFLLSFDDISDVKQLQAKQQYQAMWNNILHSYSYRFINFKLADFSSEVSSIISEAASFFKLDRVAIFLLNKNSNSAKIYLEWLKHDCLSLKQFSKKIDIQDSAVEFSKLKNGILQLLRPEEIIKKSSDLSCFGLSEHYAQVGTQSSVIIPLEKNGTNINKNIIGWLSLDYQSTDNKWNEDDLTLLEPLGKLISEGFARRAQEEHRRMTHQKLSENHGRLSEQAFTDGLTNLANRRYFDKVLESEVRRASRDGGCLSVLFCDVDYFKAYNDTYGHLEGDVCLKAIAKVLKQEFQRASDFVARFGGEEFAVILSGMSLEDANEAAEKLKNSIIEQNILHHGAPIGQLSLSIGVASVIAPQPDDANKILSKADKALYKAKSNGRNRVEVVSYIPEQNN